MKYLRALLTISIAALAFGCDETYELHVTPDHYVNEDQPEDCDPSCQDDETCINAKCMKMCDNTHVNCDDTCVDLKELHLASCTSCEKGYCDSDDNILNGCDINYLSDDIDHCGACDVSCSPDEVCQDGVCTPSCDEGLTYCFDHCVDLAELKLASCNQCLENYCDSDSDLSNGCEIDVMSDDAQNCGKCGQKCPSGHSCDQGKCKIGCNENEAICSGNCVNFQARHLATCDTCANGFANCNNNLNDGCEINITKDNQNCGACGNPCKEGESCQNSVCKSICKENETYCNGTCIDLNAIHMASCDTCATGYVDCNQSFTDGCEININTDNKNCGACATACKSGEKCTSGACKSICKDGETYCNNACIALSSNHMTACNKCASGYGNCDNNFANGCETNLSSNNQHCGACGNACKSGEKCTSGVCKSTYNQHKRMVVATTELNVRSNPDTNSTRLGSLKQYDYFMATGEQNGWYQLTFNGKTGWVSGNYTMNACQECASRKAIDEAEKYLWTVHPVCTYELYVNHVMPNLTYGGGWDNNCANFVTAALQNVNLYSVHHIAVADVRDHCSAGKDGYRETTFSQAKAGDIWLVKTDKRSHTELVVGTYKHPANGVLYMVTVGSTNFQSCNPSSGRGGGFQLVTYTDRVQDEARIFTRQ